MKYHLENGRTLAFRLYALLVALAFWLAPVTRAAAELVKPAHASKASSRLACHGSKGSSCHGADAEKTPARAKRCCCSGHGTELRSTRCGCQHQHIPTAISGDRALLQRSSALGLAPARGVAAAIVRALIGRPLAPPDPPPRIRS